MIFTFYIFQREPTVYPASNFNVTEDGDTLRAAMKGMGTDEDTIIEILTSRSNSQRQQIAKYFEQQLGRVCRNFIVAGKVLCSYPSQALCFRIKKTLPLIDRGGSVIDGLSGA